MAAAERAGFDFETIGYYDVPWLTEQGKRHTRGRRLRSCWPVTGSPSGLGAGENLNEHVVGRDWSSVNVGHEMLVEAIQIIAALFAGGMSTSSATTTG